MCGVASPVFVLERLGLGDPIPQDSNSDASAISLLASVGVSQKSGRQAYKQARRKADKRLKVFRQKGKVGPFCACCGESRRGDRRAPALLVVTVSLQIEREIVARSINDLMDGKEGRRAGNVLGNVRARVGLGVTFLSLSASSKGDDGIGIEGVTPAKSAD